MSRFPAPATGRIRVPSGQLNVGSLGVGGPRATVLGAVGASIEQFGDQLLKARRSRQLTEWRSTIIGKLAEAEDLAAQADPEQAEGIFQSGVAELQQQTGSFRDREVQSAAQAMLQDESTRSAIRVRRASAGREARLGIASDDKHADNLIGQIERGDISASQGSDAFSLGIASKVNSSYDEAQAERRIEQFNKRAAREEYNRLLRIDPGQAAIFMESEFAIANLPADERRGSIKRADEELDEFNERTTRDIFARSRRQVLDLLGKDVVSQSEFKETVDLLVDELKSRPNLDRIFASTDKETLRSALLADHLELMARRGEEEKFELIVEEMPKTVEAQLAVEQHRTTLERVLSASLQRADQISEVQFAIQNKYSLDNTATNRALIGQSAEVFIAEMLASDEPISGAEIKKRLVNRYGPTGILPPQIVLEAESAIRNPETTSSEKIIEAVEFLDYVRINEPHAFTTSFDNDTRAFARLYRETAIPGQNPKDVAQFVRNSLSPKEPARATEIAQREDEFRRFAEGKLVELIDQEWEIDLQADLSFKNLFRTEDETTAIRAELLGDVIPFSVVRQFSERVLNGLRTGQTKEAAVATAWEELSRSVGPTRVFQDSPVIRPFAMERIYGSDGYGPDEMETDIANVMGLDAFSGQLLMPEASDGNPFPKPKGMSGFSLGGDNINMVSDQEIKAITTYATDHMDFVPHPTLSVMIGDAQLRLYQPMFIDDNGALHPVMRQVNGKIEPYLIAPIESEGVTHFSKVSLQQRDLPALRKRRERRARFMQLLKEAQLRSAERIQP